MDTSAADDQSPTMSGDGDVSATEFEFWMMGNNPSVPQPDLLTADELFVDGVLLPLMQLTLCSSTSNPASESQPEVADETAPPPPPQASVHAANPDPTSTNLNVKKWRDLFKMGDKALEELRERRKQRRESAAGGAPELNIHIWPFSRSRSAGNAGAGSRQSRVRSLVSGRRKVSSAPCSRSNSRGESSKPAATTTGHTVSSRRWAMNPVRVGLAGGIHLAMANPVWKLRRKINQAADSKEKFSATAATATGGAGARRAGVGSGSGNAGVRVLNFKVNTCIGYRNQVSCRINHSKRMSDTGAGAAEQADGENNANGSINGSLFNLRTILSKKVY